MTEKSNTPERRALERFRCIPPGQYTDAKILTLWAALKPATQERLLEMSDRDAAAGEIVSVLVAWVDGELDRWRALLSQHPQTHEVMTAAKHYVDCLLTVRHALTHVQELRPGATFPRRG